jgi:hypothetical protein
MFLAVAFCCLWWLHSVGGCFGVDPVERAASLRNEALVEVRFSPSAKGEQSIGIWYPRNASSDVSNDLNKLFGRANLLVGGNPVAEILLPTYHTSCDHDGCGMILFTGPMTSRSDYSLSLKIDRMPQALEQFQAVVKIELTPEYHSLFFTIECLAAVLILAAFSCAYLSISWLHVANAYKARKTSEISGNE